VPHRQALQRLEHQAFDQLADCDDHHRAGKQAAVKGQASAPRPIKGLCLDRLRARRPLRRNRFRQFRRRCSLLPFAAGAAR